MDTKSFLLSKTLWGLVVTVLAQVLAKYGYTIDQDGTVNDIVSLMGVGLTAYGRFVASQPLHVMGTPAQTPPAGKQGGFSSLDILLLYAALSLAALVVVGCASTPSPATVAYDAQLAGDQAVKSIPALLKAHAISGQVAQDIVTAADNINTAAGVVQACTSSGDPTLICATTAVDDALAKLMALLPAAAASPPAK